jgi:hypothetical protein
MLSRRGFPAASRHDRKPRTSRTRRTFGHYDRAQSTVDYVPLRTGRQRSRGELIILYDIMLTLFSGIAYW